MSEDAPTEYDLGYSTGLADGYIAGVEERARLAKEVKTWRDRFHQLEATLQGTE